MLRNKKSMFSDEEESEDEDENAIRASQRNVFESDEEEGEGEGNSKKSDKGRQKRKRGGQLLESDSDKDGDDSDSFKNSAASKTKNRRGIIASESDSDGESDSSSGREEDGDDEENLCPICLGGFEDQMVGIPENCGHIFCITCIQEWSKNVNNCPVDRIKFNKITIKDMNGKFIDDVIIKDVKKDDNVSDEPPTYCQVCGECNREDCMLLCDECDNGYHMDCLTPPLECVPIDEWYCIECTPTEVSPPATTTRATASTNRRQNTRTNRRAQRRDRNNDDSEDERADLVNSLMSSVFGAINRPGGRGRGRSGGEGSNARQARTVASSRTNRRQTAAVEDVSARLSCLRARARSNPKKRDKRKRKKARAAARKAGKKVIKGEFEKLNDVVDVEGLPTGVSLFGNHLHLDCFEDPMEDLKEPSPVRSTIVDTPDVVGHILGLSTLHEEDLVVARDGQGTLTKKPKEEPRKKNSVQSILNKKRKLRFQFDSDEDDINDGDVDDDDYDTLKNKKAESKKIKKKKKLYILDEENVDGDKDSGGESMDISDDEKAAIPSDKKKISAEDDEKQKAKVETATKSRVELANEKEKKSKEELNDDDDKEKKEGTSKSNKRVHFAEFGTEPKERRSTLVENTRQRLKVTMERKAKEEELKKECQKMRENSDPTDIKTNSSLVNVASFKIPKLKKKEKPVDLRSESEKRKQDKISRFYQGLKLDQKTLTSDKKIIKKDKVNNDSSIPEKIDVSPTFHQEGSQRKTLIDSIKREAIIPRDNTVRKRPPLTDLEKKVRQYQEGILLSPEYKRKKKRRPLLDEKSEVLKNSKISNDECQNIETKTILSSKSSEEQNQKKSISFNDYKIRKIRGDSDDIRSKNGTKTDVVKNTEGLSEMNKMLFGDSDSESPDQPRHYSSTNNKLKSEHSSKIDDSSSSSNLLPCFSDTSRTSSNSKPLQSSTISSKSLTTTSSTTTNTSRISSSSTTNVVALTKRENTCEPKRPDDRKLIDKNIIKQTSYSSSSGSKSVNDTSRTNFELKRSDVKSPIAESVKLNSNTGKLYSKYINPSSKLYSESNSTPQSENGNNLSKNCDSKTRHSESNFSANIKSDNKNSNHNVSENINSGKHYLEKTNTEFKRSGSGKHQSDPHTSGKHRSQFDGSVKRRSGPHNTGMLPSEAHGSGKHHSETHGSGKHHSEPDKSVSYQSGPHGSGKHHSKNDKNSSSNDINKLANNNELENSIKTTKHSSLLSPASCKDSANKNKHASSSSNSSSSSSKFHENSPYSVIRPFGLNSSSNTPVAVVSPSLRDDASSSYANSSKASLPKSTNNETSENMSDKQSNKLTSPIDPPQNKPTFFSSHSSENVLIQTKVPTIAVNMKLEVGHKSNNEIAIEKLKAVEKLKAEGKQKKRENPYEKAEFIDTIKECLKEYFKRGKLSKEQWKFVVKTSVRIVATNPASYSTYEQIKWLVEKNAAPFLRLHAATTSEDE